MNLTGEQTEQLQNAFLDTYNRADLEQFVSFKLDERLDNIASGGNMPQTVFELIEWAEQRGRLADLIQAAYADRPSDPFFAMFSGREPSPTVQPSSSSARTSPAQSNQKRSPRQIIGFIVGIIGLIASVLAIIAFCQPRPSDIRASGFCPTDLSFSIDFEGAKEDETLVVVSQFANTNGEDPDDITSQIVEEMRDELEPHETVRIEWLNCAILQRNGSEMAMSIGRRTDIDASIVIWGVYVGTDRESKMNIFFDIVKEKETYLGDGFNQRFGPDAMMPSMFNFIADIGTQAGQVVAFAAGLALFNSSEHLAAEPFFTTAIAVTDQQIASEFSLAVYLYRGTNYQHLGRALEAKEDLAALWADIDSDSELYIPTLNNIGGVYSALGDKEQALEFYNSSGKRDIQEKEIVV